MNDTDRLPPFIALTLVVLLGGCGIGTNKMLFVTRSNAGIDIDSSPPTAEITVARREGVIGPVFEGGKHVPVASSFFVGGSLLSAKVNATFAGGSAATHLAKGLGQAQPSATHSGTVCLSEIPKDAGLPGPGDVRPFIFGTDTSWGLKIAWSGTGAAGGFPDTLKFGFNRKEFALAPLFLNADGCPATDGSPNNKTVGVTSPSFYAEINSGYDVKGPSNTGFDYGQLFATGSAADDLAKSLSVREAFQGKVESQVHTAAYSNEANSAKLKCWVAQEQTGSSTRMTSLRQWMAAQKPPIQLEPEIFLNDPSQVAHRAQAAQQLNAVCTTS